MAAGLQSPPAGTADDPLNTDVSITCRYLRAGRKHRRRTWIAWEDEAEQLTLEVVNRLGDAALSGAIKQALSDMQRDGEQCNPPDWVKEVTAGGDARFYSGEGYLQAYKTRLRMLLTTH